jgi:hypothetical protein
VALRAMLWPRTLSVMSSLETYPDPYHWSIKCLSKAYVAMVSQVRRAKKDILKDLPPKRRCIRTADVPDETVRNRLLAGLRELKSKEVRGALMQAFNRILFFSFV